MSKMSRAAQAHNPQCPKGHSLIIEDDGDFLWGTCATCSETWRVMFDGSIIADGHPLGGQPDAIILPLQPEEDA